MTIKVNNLANFEFWLGIYKSKTKSWQKDKLRRLKINFSSMNKNDKPEEEDKIKALEFLLGKR